MTKCGRYGSPRADFDYSPATIRASVERSLKRLNTTYLDAVYLHDVEFVAAQVGPREAGHPTDALKPENLETYGLADGQEAKVWGDGDRLILDGLAELQKMKDEGLIKAIGLTGASSRASRRAPCADAPQATRSRRFCASRSSRSTPHRTSRSTCCSPIRTSRFRTARSPRTRRPCASAPASGSSPPRPL